MNRMAELILSVAALGMLALTLQVLILQQPRQAYLQPLMIALCALGLMLSGPLVFQVFPALIDGYIAALPLAFFALLPSLYLYVQALTAPHAWQWRSVQGKHYWTQVFALALALQILSLPATDRQALFFGDPGPLHGQMLITAATFLLATLLWLVASGWYVLRISLQLRQYRRQLRRVFAADAGKRLYWLDGLLAALLLSWAYALLFFVLEERVHSRWLSAAGVILLALLLVSLLCVCALRQQPGFAELFGSATVQPLPDPAAEAETPLSTEAAKYQRSALSEEQAQRIAEKARQAVYEQALYLNPALTLYQLADHIGVPAQYLSQTLNQTLGLSFYDYINAARIKAAKQQLVQTEDSILSIAMAVGFNARSSFYKAFKASTGMTPVMYRAAQGKSVMG
ncbi:Helix-turn-helix domain-containing protein [Chitinimonas taiwanensis DSM 18899]|uniref:Helix-turn-helix domain-containing protein n=2 Tax=Chitinimonas TaxID=240411 RepID=A0A1K2HEZ1_9NEIS|nr:Helix-turn-helix domain-containing protein [Chitinimonas taiwanensis DSM 18899]